MHIFMNSMDYDRYDSCVLDDILYETSKRLTDYCINRGKGKIFIKKPPIGLTPSKGEGLTGRRYKYTYRYDSGIWNEIIYKYINQQKEEFYMRKPIDLMTIPKVNFNAGERLKEHGYTYRHDSGIWFDIFDAKSNVRVYRTNSLVDACLYLGIA